MDIRWSKLQLQRVESVDVAGLPNIAIVNLVQEEHSTFRCCVCQSRGSNRDVELGGVITVSTRMEEWYQTSRCCARQLELRTVEAVLAGDISVRTGVDGRR